MREALVRDFCFADDCTLAAHSEDDLQRLADRFSTASKAFGLMISIKKTEVLLQAAPGTSRPDPSIKINGSPLKNVGDFTYLASCLSPSGSLYKKISCHLAKRQVVPLGNSGLRVWHVCGITQKTKVVVEGSGLVPSKLSMV